MHNNLLCTVATAASPHSRAAPIRRLTGVVPVYAERDQDVCCVDM
jgi:hypothetical protein